MGKEVQVDIQLDRDPRENSYRMYVYFENTLKAVSHELIAKVLCECATMIASDIKDRIIEEVAASIDVNAVAEMVTREIVADTKRRILGSKE
jgi:hypothetical protein